MAVLVQAACASATALDSTTASSIGSAIQGASGGLVRDVVVSGAQDMPSYSVPGLPHVL